MQEAWVPPLGWEDALEREMAIHSRIPAWESLWTAEPGGLQSMGLQRVRHDLASKQQTQWISAKWGNHFPNFLYVSVSQSQNQTEARKRGGATVPPRHARARLPVTMLSADRQAKAWISRFRLCKLKEKSLMESSHSPNPRRHWSRCRTSPLQNTNLSSAVFDLREKVVGGWG